MNVMRYPPLPIEGLGNSNPFAYAGNLLRKSHDVFMGLGFGFLIWIFWGIPVFFLGSSIFFFLFLESPLAKIILVVSLDEIRENDDLKFLKTKLKLLFIKILKRIYSNFI